MTLKRTSLLLHAALLLMASVSFADGVIALRVDVQGGQPIEAAVEDGAMLTVHHAGETIGIVPTMTKDGTSIEVSYLNEDNAKTNTETFALTGSIPYGLFEISKSSYRENVAMTITMNGERFMGKISKGKMFTVSSNGETFGFVPTRVNGGVEVEVFSQSSGEDVASSRHLETLNLTGESPSYFGDIQVELGCLWSEAQTQTFKAGQEQNMKPRCCVHCNETDSICHGCRVNSTCGRCCVGDCCQGP